MSAEINEIFVEGIRKSLYVEEALAASSRSTSICQPLSPGEGMTGGVEMDTNEAFRRYWPYLLLGIGTLVSLLLVMILQSR